MTSRSSHHQQGFTLVEVLVTVVVVTFGLLSVLKLQITGFDVLNQSQNHYLASTLASDMAERLRANPRQAGLYQVDDTRNLQLDCSIPENCNLANHDLWQWHRQITAQQGLPSGYGSIAIANGMADISLYWHKRDAGSRGGNAEENLHLQVALP